MDWHGKAKVWAMCVGLGLGLATPSRADERILEVTGYLVQLGKDDREQPVVGGVVSVRGLENPARSKEQGFFRLPLLGTVYRPGQQLTVTVQVPGWQLYQPEGGVITLPEVPAKQPLTLKLLPLGSKRFLERLGLVELIRRAMSEVKDQPSRAASLPGTPSPVDLKGPIQKWASEYGLGVEQVQSAVDAWATEVLKRRDQGSDESCLAHYAQQKFAESAACFTSLGQSELRELQKLQQQVQQRTEQAVRHFIKAGESHQARYDHAAALHVYKQAAQLVRRDQSPELWAELQNWLGIAHHELGIRVDGAAAGDHLRQALAAYRAAQQVYIRESLPQHWAMTQNNLAASLDEQAKRTTGEEETRLLEDAVAASRLALQVYTRESLPQHWAMTQNNLSVLLKAQANRTTGEGGMRLLEDAVAASRLALQVYTRESLPQDWAMTQNNLALSLVEQANRTTGEGGTKLLGDAVAAYRLALQVLTRESLPQHWAMTQNNLANSLSEQANRTLGEQGMRLLGNAVAAYRLALQVLTRESLPQHWALTQNNLALSLVEQAKRSPGPPGRKLLEEAVAAYRMALDVRTVEALPQQWAQTQRNLARACTLLGDERCAADGFASVLRLYPDEGSLYTEAYVRYHERLFDYAQAFALNQARLARHPDDLDVQSNFIESHLTTGRFAGVSVQLAKHWPKLAPSGQIALTAIEISALTGLGQTSQVALKRKVLSQLLAAQPTDFKLGWTFGGTRHFLSTDPRFASSRARLLALFDALEQPNRAAIETDVAAAWPIP